MKNSQQPVGGAGLTSQMQRPANRLAFANPGPERITRCGRPAPSPTWPGEKSAAAERKTAGADADSSTFQPPPQPDTSARPGAARRPRPFAITEHHAGTPASTSGSSCRLADRPRRGSGRCRRRGAGGSSRTGGAALPHRRSSQPAGWAAAGRVGAGDGQPVRGRPSRPAASRAPASLAGRRRPGWAAAGPGAERSGPGPGQRLPERPRLHGYPRRRVDPFGDRRGCCRRAGLRRPAGPVGRRPGRRHPRGATRRAGRRRGGGDRAGHPPGVPPAHHHRRRLRPRRPGRRLLRYHRPRRRHHRGHRPVLRLDPQRGSQLRPG